MQTACTELQTIPGHLDALLLGPLFDDYDEAFGPTPREFIPIEEVPSSSGDPLDLLVRLEEEGVDNPVEVEDVETSTFFLVEDHRLWDMNLNGDTSDQDGAQDSDDEGVEELIPTARALRLSPRRFMEYRRDNRRGPHGSRESHVPGRFRPSQNRETIRRL